MSLSDCLDRPIAFHRVFVDLTGSVCAAVMLSQAVYWSKRSGANGGWFYKTQEEWEEETGLSRREQETAREKLRAAGFWHEERRGVPAKLFFRIDQAALLAAIQAQPARKRQSSMAESANLECPNPPDKPAPSRQTISAEITAETTTPPPPPAAREGRGIVPMPELKERLAGAFKLTNREMRTLDYGGEGLRTLVDLELDQGTLESLERLWRIPNGEQRPGRRIWHSETLSAFLREPDKDITRARTLFPSRTTRPPTRAVQDPVPPPEPSLEEKRANMAAVRAAARNPSLLTQPQFDLP